MSFSFPHNIDEHNMFHSLVVSQQKRTEREQLTVPSQSLITTH
jgi:hypothetical protein